MIQLTSSNSIISSSESQRFSPSCNSKSKTSAIWSSGGWGKCFQELNCQQQQKTRRKSKQKQKNLKFTRDANLHKNHSIFYFEKRIFQRFGNNTTSSKTTHTVHDQFTTQIRIRFFRAIHSRLGLFSLSLFPGSIHFTRSLTSTTI